MKKFDIEEMVIILDMVYICALICYLFGYIK
jgi:hypothetical protein